MTGASHQLEPAPPPLDRPPEERDELEPPDEELELRDEEPKLEPPDDELDGRVRRAVLWRDVE